jgi:hypothetical protein
MELRAIKPITHVEDIAKKIKFLFEILNADYFKKFFKHLIRILILKCVIMKYLIFAWVCFAE